MSSSVKTLDKSLQTLANNLRHIVTKIWNAVCFGVNLIKLFGGLVMLGGVVPGKNEEQNGSQASGSSDDGGLTQRNCQAGDSLLQITLSTCVRTISKFCQPTSSWIPLSSAMLALIFGLKALEDQKITLPGTKEVQASCPEGNRRTQNAVFIKLFAASVTTVCIHGHLGSLTGSVSWRRELFRIAEVLISPLSPTFSFALAAWYEFAGLLKIALRPWKKTITWNYRLARLCNCRVDTDPPPLFASNSHLAAINPQHIKKASRKRDLKWGGRVLILVILFAQYVQASVLLTRRLLSNTAATIDYAMSFMVLSGLTALFQSITISLINVYWTIEADTSPCAAKECSLQGCIRFKSQQGFSDAASRVKAFGFNVGTIFPPILHNLVGGYTQLAVILQSKQSIWQNITGLFSLHMCWPMMLYCILWADVLATTLTGGQQSPTRPGEHGSPEHQPESILPDLVSYVHSTESVSKPFVYSYLDVCVHTAMFIVGILAILVFIVVVAVQLSYLLFPCVSLYAVIWYEMKDWKVSVPTVPCPQQWKDGLEDELWWF